MILTLAISGYRSIRDLRVELNALNVVTGANGSGKSSFYRALQLLAQVAQGGAISSLAAEGGLTSTLWAGPENFSRAMKSGQQPVQGTVRKNPISLKLGFGSDDYGYAIDIGLPASVRGSMFNNDPEIKAESLWVGETISRRNEIAIRRGSTIQLRNSEGALHPVFNHLSTFDSMMTHGQDMRDGIELLMLREKMRKWRFYDHLRTDQDAPARQPQIGTRTPVLSGTGSDLAAALQTILEVGDGAALRDTIEDAFPGTELSIANADSYFSIELAQPGLLRPLRATEISDGTLRYLLLVAALLSPRMPDLTILNEPETSLHPNLLAPLARLISRAAANTQLIIVTHSNQLSGELSGAEKCNQIELEKQLGETVVRDGVQPSWVWPSR